MEDLQPYDSIMKCRHCGNTTVLKTYGRYYHRDEYEEEILNSTFISTNEYACTLYICQTCRKPTLEEFSDSGYHVDETVILYPISSKEPKLSKDLPETILPPSLFKDTRGYIEQIGHQINNTYSCACYDACAVMIRRLIETLIIEAFEENGIAATIKNSSGDFLALSDLIGFCLKENKWNLGRNTVKFLQSLPKLKAIGDLSAHNRRYNAHREDIDKVQLDLRTITQELIYLAKFK